MRGFGAVQVAVAYEAQMDRLAGALGVDPAGAAGRQRAARGRRAADRAGGPRAGRGAGRCSSALVSLPMPARDADPRDLPGGAFRATDGEGVRARRSATRRGSRTSRSRRASTTRRPRGCGWSARDGRLSARSTPPPTEVGQGVTRRAGADRAHRAGHRRRATCWPADTRIAIGGVGVARRGLTWIARRRGPGGACRGASRGRDSMPCRRAAVVEAERTYRHARTQPMDPVTGQGDSHAGLRVRRAPGGRRRRRRAGAGAGRRAGLRTGRRARR